MVIPAEPRLLGADLALRHFRIAERLGIDGRYSHGTDNVVVAVDELANPGRLVESPSNPVLRDAFLQRQVI